MADLNNVNIIGRLGKDLELKTTQNQKSVVRGTIAVNNGFGDSASTNWIRFVAYGKTAEVMAEHLHKGSRIAIAGELNQWVASKEGEPYSEVVEIFVRNFYFLDSKSDNQQSQQQNNTFAGEFDYTQF